MTEAKPSGGFWEAILVRWGDRVEAPVLTRRGPPLDPKYLDRYQPDIVRELRDLIDTIGQEHTGVV
jgi:hypothetical protein